MHKWLKAERLYRNSSVSSKRKSGDKQRRKRVVTERKHLTLPEFMASGDATAARVLLRATEKRIFLAESDQRLPTSSALVLCGEGLMFSTWKTGKPERLKSEPVSVELALWLIKSFEPDVTDRNLMNHVYAMLDGEATDAPW